MASTSDRTIQRQLQTEVDASFLYETISKLEANEAVSNVFKGLSDIEKRHADRGLTASRDKGYTGELPPPSGRAKVQSFLAKTMGYSFILPNLLDMEKKLSFTAVKSQKEAGEPIHRGVFNHVQILKGLGKGTSRVSGASLASLEGKHRNVGGNALRAAVLGANDGLVSNLSLVMGVAGATSGSRAILIAGFAGLLAGSISMALGEWLSVQSSRELYQRQLEVELEELENSPEEEMEELILIYQAKGLSREEATGFAANVFENKDTAHDTMIREELGFDPEELGGSAWEAAFASFFLFAIGAILPVIPFLFVKGMEATLWSLGISTIGLFGIGAAITLFTGRSVWSSGLRQVVFGLLAAAITFGIGKVIGVSIAG